MTNTTKPPEQISKPAPVARPVVATGRPVATPQNRYPFKTTPSGTEATRFTAFIYGFSGSGKTFLARTALQDPELFPILVCVCDRGSLTLQDVIDDQKLVVTDTRGFGDFNPIFEFLKAGKHPFKTILIDNLSELQRSGLMEQARRSSQGKDNRTGSEYTQQDYGIVRNQMLSLVSNFALELNINVIFTALASQINDQVTGISTIEPGLSGKVAHEVPGYCDVVGYLYVKTPTMMERKAGQTESTRMLQVSQTTLIPTARNRGGKLGLEMVNPTLPRMFHLLVEK